MTIQAYYWKLSRQALSAAERMRALGDEEAAARFREMHREFADKALFGA